MSNYNFNVGLYIYNSQNNNKINFLLAIKSEKGVLNIIIVNQELMRLNHKLPK